MSRLPHKPVHTRNLELKTIVLTAALVLPIVPAAPAAPMVDPPSESLPAGAMARFSDGRFRHPGPIHSSALSPDGARLATLSTQVLQVLDLKTGRPVFQVRLSDPVDFATPDLSFSPDGRYLASTLNRKLTLVWDAVSGRVVLRLPRAESADQLCQFLPDGSLALTTDRWTLDKPGRTFFIEVASGREIRGFPVGGLAVLSPDGQRFVKPDWGGLMGKACVLVGDARTGKALHRLPANAFHGGSRTGLAFSGDGKWIAIFQAQKEVQLWDTDQGKKFATIPLPVNNTDYYKIGFLGNGKTTPRTFWLAGGWDFYRWVVVRGEPQEEILLQPYWGGHVTGAHTLQGGRVLLLTGTDGLIRRWDFSKDRQYEQTLDVLIGRLQIAPTPDGKHLLLGDRSRRVEVCDAATGRVVRTLTRPKPRELGSSQASLAVSPDGRSVALGLATGTVRVLRLANGAEQAVYRRGDEEPVNWMRAAVYSPDGRRLLVSGYRDVWAHDTETGRIAWTVAGPLAVDALLPDGRLLLGNTGQSRLAIVEPATGKALASFPVLPPGDGAFDQLGQASVLAVSPDGRLFALADREGVKVRRTRDGDLRWSVEVPEPEPVAWSFEAGTHGVLALAFSPNGRWLSAGRHDGQVSVWEVATGRVVRQFAGHHEAVHAVTFAGDGRSLFSAGQDGLVYRWSLAPQPVLGVAQTSADLWAAVAGKDPALAYNAAAVLLATEANRRFLRDRLPPAKQDATADQVRQWIANLGSPDFATREAASRELANRARLWESALRKAVEATRDADVEARLKQILAALDEGLTHEELQAVRMVQAAELAGTEEARVLLKEWAQGTPNAILTAEARLALGRLCRQESR